MNYKSIAFIDVDGVLVDTHEEFRVYLNQKFGLDLPVGFQPNDWSYSDVVPAHGLNDDKNKTGWFYEFPTDWVCRVKPYLGANLFLNALRESGARVILVSKCPEDRVADRIRNLAKGKLVYDEFLPVPLKGKKSAFINATLERFPNLPWFYLDDSSSEILDVLTNCPPQPPHRIISILRPYTQSWIEKNPEKAKWAYWSANEVAAYGKAIDVAEMDAYYPAHAS